MFIWIVQVAKKFAQIMFGICYILWYGKYSIMTGVFDPHSGRKEKSKNCLKQVLNFVGRISQAYAKF